MDKQIQSCFFHLILFKFKVMNEEMKIRNPYNHLTITTQNMYICCLYKPIHNVCKYRDFRKRCVMGRHHHNLMALKNNENE